MGEYTKRLRALGFSMLSSARIYEFFVKYFDRDILDYIIDKMERDKHVENVQSESDRA